MQHWEFTDPLYGAPITLLRSTPEEASVWLTKHMARPEGPVNGAARTMFFEQPPGKAFAIVLWFGPDFQGTTWWQKGVIAHEALHATAFVMRHVGIGFEDASDEAYAYYLGWVVSQLACRLAHRTQKVARKPRKAQPARSRTRAA